MSYLKTQQLGKKKPTRTQTNIKANKELKKLWKAKGIDKCELCGSKFMLTNMHRHKRVYYYNKPDELLWDFSECILACQRCHDRIENNRKETDKVFKRLRHG